MVLLSSMRTFTLLIFFLFSTVASANVCFQSEKNFRTGTRFKSAGEYSEELKWWENKAPNTPSIFSLVKAYFLYSNQKAYVDSLKSDKVAHCYLGCRISQVTSYSTADYVGWLKEQRDLTDCKPKTRFDEADYQATIRGGQIGENRAADCLQACRQVYK